MRSLFVFRQDLRVQDNTGLWNAIQDSEQVFPVFIFDTTILDTFPLEDKRVAFLLEAVQQLQKDIASLGGQLIVCYGKSTSIIPALMEKLNCDALCQNRSYGEASMQRDAVLKKLCNTNRKIYKDFSDYLLVEPHDVAQRKVFTPFYKLRMELPKRTNLLQIHQIPTPQQTTQLISEHIVPSIVSPTNDSGSPYHQLTKHLGTNKHRPIDAGSTIIHTLDTSMYTDERNFPAIHGTSRLSPYTRFGLVSIREVFRKAIKQAQSHGSVGIQYNKEQETITMDRKIFKDSFISELAWREFRQHINHYFPYTRAIAFQEKRASIERDNDTDYITAWKEGKTGYPIVDAGMRQLKEENWMHGRVRMVVASFLTKDLHVDWKIGEQHFRDYLIDYDANVNVGNWQWSASVGADPKPLRIFNPILQSQRFDPEAAYIKKRIPEIADQEIKAIHDPLKHDLDYVSPIVDHYTMSKQAKEMYARSAEKITTIHVGGDTRMEY